MSDQLHTFVQGSLKLFHERFDRIDATLDRMSRHIDGLERLEDRR